MSESLLEKLMSVPQLTPEQVEAMERKEMAWRASYQREGCPYGLRYEDFVRWVEDQERAASVWKLNFDGTYTLNEEAALRESTR